MNRAARSVAPSTWIGAEMLVEPRPPDRLHGVAGLEDGLQRLRAPAMDEPEMAAVLARHQLEDDARLAVLARAEHDAFVGPLHGTPDASVRACILSKIGV